MRTIASEWMFTPEPRSGAICAVLSEWSLPPLDLWAVFPTGAPRQRKRGLLLISSNVASTRDNELIEATPFRRR
jgi:hypothetical protein